MPRITKTLTLIGLLAITIWPFTAAASVEYFRDDFTPSGPEEKYFFEGVLGDKLFKYELGGNYVIDATKASDFGHSVLMHDLSTYELEARGKLTAGTTPKVIDGVPVKAGWGITFNYSEFTDGAERFMLALVNPAEHNFVLRRVVDNRQEDILGPFVSDAVSPDYNVLRVKVDAGRITAYVNGAEVGSCFEDQLLSGGFGLYVTPRTAGAFDYIAVYTDHKPRAVVEDDFIAQPRRWFAGEHEGVKYEYAGGGYIIRATGPAGKAGMSFYPGEHTEFALEVTVSKLSGPSNFGYGVFFQDIPNEQGGFDQFRFLISGDGWFTVQRSFEDVPRALFQWAQSGRIKPGEANRLKVSLVGGQLAFLINGYEVYSLSDLPVTPGKLGLYASAGVEAEYEDFRLELY
jgi:hypothetical protein